MARSSHDVLHEIDLALPSDQRVPNELVIQLVTLLPVNERNLWFEMLLGYARPTGSFPNSG